MRGVVWIVLLFTVAVVAATTLGGNDGLVSIYWSGWRTDLSLNLFVLLLLGLCIVLFAVLQTLHGIASLPQRAQAWRDSRKQRAAEGALREALAEHFSARWGRAVKAAQRALEIQRDNPALRDDAEFATLARLIGAASLHRLQDRRRRDEWLAQHAPGRSGARADDGVRLLAAEWALDDHDLARAQALLADLPPGTARRTQALRLKLQVARAAGDHAQALHTARLLANHGAFSELAAVSLLRTLAGEALAAAHDRDQLRRVWDELDPTDRRDPLVAARAAQRAAQLITRAGTLASGADAAALADDARGWLRPFWDRLPELDNEQRQQVAFALVDVTAGLGTEWLPRLEAAQQSHGHDAAVQAAVGHAYAERQLWGKARRPLEAAALAPALPQGLRRRCWRLLAEVAGRESDGEAARRFEQAAAALD